MKKTMILKVWSVFISLIITTAGLSATVPSARIIPTGKVSIISEGKVIGEFSKEAPLPEGAKLRCEATCTVKTKDLYVSVEPETTFSIKPMANGTELAVDQGTAYFSLSKVSSSVEFKSPAGNASTREISMTGSEIKGYIRVSGNKMEIGVIEGGSMTLETASGEIAITPGNQVTSAAINSETAATAMGKGGLFGSMSKATLGFASAGILVSGAAALNTVDWGKGSSGSPSSP
jgi:hypothetical protein